MARKYEKHEIDDDASDAYIANAVLDFIFRAEEAGAPWRVYVNRTNGIQALPVLCSNFIHPEFCYIRSTHFERKQPNSAISDIPFEMLELLALGAWIIVVDYGARKDRSRAIWQGVPYLEYVLNRAWLNIVPDRCIIYPRSNTDSNPQNVGDVFDQWYGDIDDATMEKITLYADTARKTQEMLIGTGEPSIHIEGVSAPTSHDNDKEYYRNIMQLYQPEIAKHLGRKID